MSEDSVVCSMHRAAPVADVERVQAAVSPAAMASEAARASTTGVEDEAVGGSPGGRRRDAELVSTIARAGAQSVQGEAAGGRVAEQHEDEAEDVADVVEGWWGWR